MISAILYNPFRLIGVYATSSKKEMVANLTRLKANLRVNRQVAFPADLSPLLPTLERTADTLAAAEAQLSLTQDFIRHAQFWFIDATPLDKIALGHLTAGDAPKAVAIWKKKVSAASLHNLMITHLIQARYEKALDLAYQLYTDYTQEWTKLVLGADHGSVSTMDLGKAFLDVLCEELTPRTVMTHLKNESWKEYVGTSLTAPLMAEIENQIAQAKATRGKSITARLQAGQTLKNKTSEALRELQQLLATDEPQYQMLVDKLGLEILQCGIDYYNGSEAADAAHKAMQLQRYALSIVVGQRAKERCQENVSILERIIRDLPPVKVLEAHQKIQTELRKFNKQPSSIERAVDLIKACEPHLAQIKAQLGKNDAYYLRTSTNIAQHALHDIIEEVNAIQRGVNSEQKMGDTTKESERIAKAILGVMCLDTALTKASRAMEHIDKMDLEAEFREGRYRENRAILRKLVEQNKTLQEIIQPQKQEEDNEFAGCLVWIAIIIIGAIIAIATRS